MKNSNETIGNRTRDLPICSDLCPNQLVPPGAPELDTDRSESKVFNGWSEVHPGECLGNTLKKTMAAFTPALVSLPNNVKVFSVAIQVQKSVPFCTVADLRNILHCC